MREAAVPGTSCGNLGLHTAMEVEPIVSRVSVSITLTPVLARSLCAPPEADGAAKHCRITSSTTSRLAAGM
jgi:hypothetical protein